VFWVITYLLLLYDICTHLTIDAVKKNKKIKGNFYGDHFAFFILCRNPEWIEDVALKSPSGCAGYYAQMVMSSVEEFIIRVCVL